jgi:protein TonB
MKLILPFLISTVVLVGFQHATAPKSSSLKPKPPTFKDVQSVLNENCVGCHSGDRAKAEIDLSSYATMMKGGEDGLIVKPGAPKHSLIVQALRGVPGVRRMPPRHDPLAEAKIVLIENWIKAGAKN